MDKSIMLLCNASEQDLSLALMRYRRFLQSNTQGLVEHNDKRDISLKALLSCRDSAEKAIPILAEQSVVNFKARTPSIQTLFAWLCKEKPEECLIVIRSLLNPTGKLHETVQDRAPVGFKRGQEAVLHQEEEKVFEKKDEEGLKSLKLAYYLAHLIAISAPKLPNRFLETLIPVMISPLRQIGLKPEPSMYSLLLRDLVHFVIWKAVEDDGEILLRNAVHIQTVLTYEIEWVKSHSDVLRTALQSLRSVVDLVVTKLGSVTSSEEDDGIVVQLKTEAVQLLGLHWKSCGRLLAERSASAVELASRVDVLIDGNTDVLSAQFALRDACLIVGRLKDGSVIEGQEKLINGCMRALRQSSLTPEAHAMAASIVRSTFASVARSSAAANSDSNIAVVNRLLPLLDEKDGISQVAVDLVAETMFRDPASCLIEIESRLGVTTTSNDGAGTKRTTALAVLTRIIELRSRSGNNTEAKFDAVDERLTKLLVNRLGDERIDIRNQATKAFIAIAPNHVIPRLCALLDHKEDKRRSAAAEALVQCLAHNRDLASALRVLMINVTTVQQQELAFALVPRWIARISDDDHIRWQQMISTIIDCCLENVATSPQLMGFARRIGPYVAERENHKQFWIQSILRFVEKTPVLMDRGMQQSQQKDLIIARLTPFLLWRVLPSCQTHNDELNQRVVYDLCKVFSAPAGTEFPEVRRIAVEILARMEGSLPWSIFLTILSLDGPDVKNKLQQIVSSGGSCFDSYLDSIDLKRAAIYGSCQAVVGCIQNNDFGPDAFPCQIASQLVFERSCNLIFADDKDEQMFIMGSTEFVTLAVICENLLIWDSIAGQLSIENDGEKAPSVQEIVLSQSQAQHTGGVVQDMSAIGSSQRLLIDSLLSKVQGEGNSRRQALASSVLCNVARSLLAVATAPSPVPSASKSVSPPAPISMASAALKTVITQDRACRATIGMVQSTISSIIHDWSTNGTQTMKPSEQEMFVIFTCLFVGSSIKTNDLVKMLVSASDLVMLVNTCLTDMREGEPNQSVTTSIKLLGVLLTLPSDLLGLLPDGSLGRIQAALRGVANLHQMAEARQLASEILKLSFEQ